jgi:pyruvate/2-oxoglutarate dehydrogenase complex dihydrolipoamide dehydrogenase (E3) component
VILGGSYIGLEFAQVYRRFGSEVTVIEFGPRLISREDEDVSQAVAGFLKEEGIDVRVNSEVVGVEKQGNSIVAKVESSGRVSVSVRNLLDSPGSTVIQGMWPDSGEATECGQRRTVGATIAAGCGIQAT